MPFYGLRLEYALDDSSNYIAWKDCTEAILEDNCLKEFIDQEIPKPTDKTEQVEWRKYVRKLALKDKLQKIKCKRYETISMYLAKLITCRDELASVGVVTSDEDMVSLALLGLLKSWDSYQDSMNGREKLLDWKRLWSNLMQEEIRRSTKHSSSSMHDEENCALAIKAKKGKEKVSLSKASSSNEGKKVDKLKVRCFHCHEVGHYAPNYPQRKSKKGFGEGSEGEALASQFESDFTFFACMVSPMMGSGWFLDSGASFHMTRNKSLFSTLEEKNLHILIVVGNDEKYSVSSVGTIIFQREHGSHLTLTDVKYVPGLKRNLVSIAMLEDKGYDVVFSKGKVFLRHIITR
eukprot:PITA_36550